MGEMTVLCKSVKSLLAAVVIVALGSLALGYTSNVRGIVRGVSASLSTYRAAECDSDAEVAILSYMASAFRAQPGADRHPDDTPEHFESFSLDLFDCGGSTDSTRNGGTALVLARSPFLAVPPAPKALTMRATGRDRHCLARALLPSPRSPPSPRA